MKNVIVIVLLATAVWVGVQSYRAGEFAIFPVTVSADELRFRELEKELREARGRLQQAGRAAGLTGMDTTGAAEAELREIRRLEKEIAELRKKLGKD